MEDADGRVDEARVRRAQPPLRRRGTLAAWTWSRDDRVRRGRQPRGSRKPNGEVTRQTWDELGRLEDADARTAGVGLDGALGVHDRGALPLRRQLQPRARPRSTTCGRTRGHAARAGDDARLRQPRPPDERDADAPRRHDVVRHVPVLQGRPREVGDRPAGGDDLHLRRPGPRETGSRTSGGGPKTTDTATTRTTSSRTSPSRTGRSAPTATTRPIAS